ncbi:hypothetical protein MVEN_01225200 [Mycena venus]|uniref:Uncharacterized protein n=1 Tax=Mycena venus TaxID=2733690 RepID=A0A8H6Y677_9AGAR|nr:hypothetical protein MVEN_01225200 [Mycena venus]
MSTLNITVTDQSPSWIYTPNREGVSSSSWQSSWTGSPDSSYDSTHATTNIAQGTSSHFTAVAGATVQIDFVGSAVSVYGQGTAGAYSTTLDGGTPITGSPVGSMLATYGGLNATTKHTLVLNAIKSQQLSLSYATFTIRSNIPSNSIVNTTQLAVTTGANNALSTNSFFGTTGDGFSNAHSDQGYTRLDTNSANAQISFSCSNTSALLIYGTTNYDHQTFSVEIDPPAGASLGGARILNGTSKWFVLDNLLFFEAGLDPSQQYDVKFTNLNAGAYTDIHSVVMMNLPKIAEASGSGSGSASGPASKSTSSPSNPSSSATPSQAGSGVGKTVGIAVGIVGVLAALVLFAFCFRRRKMQERRKARMTIDGMVTPFGHAPGSPFVDNPHAKGSSVGTETPISLSHFRAQSEAYPNSGYGDSYPNSAYGGAYLANNQGTYSTTSAANSVRDLHAAAVGVGGRTHRPQYSELSGSEDFNPYDNQSTGLAYLRDSTYAGSTMGSGSRPPSSHVAAATTQAGSSSQPYRRPEKGPIPSDTASARAVRQEVDAGRVPEEEVLPPSYNPTWQSQS